VVERGRWKKQKKESRQAANDRQRKTKEGVGGTKTTILKSVRGMQKQPPQRKQKPTNHKTRGEKKHKDKKKRDDDGLYGARRGYGGFS